MTTLRKQILIGLTALSLGSAAFAATADDSTTAGRHGHRANAEQNQAKFAEHFAKRQAKLHDLLKLTAAQEAGWTTYQAAIKPVAHEGAAGEHGAWAKLSAPERLSKGIERSKEHTARMEGHLAAVNAFYATLSAEQKKVFDDNTLGGAHGPHHHGFMHRR